ncbi:MAG: nucleotide exchange factor GrpE [Candidatus Marinimicrobia bacterium]|nr:nucleotide exchange factor GrpE [Candidatus Neomarinimicrobiota bacterium]
MAKDKNGKKDKTIKKVTKQVSKKKNDLKAIESELNILKDKHIRLKAEFENFRRRKSEEISRLLQFEGENAIKGFLPILDDFNRMINTDNTSEQSLKDGLVLMNSKIKKYFETLEIIPFGEKGDLMNPEIHDAMLTQENKKYDEGTILDVFEKGYRYRDKVIRHAKVIVNKK